MFDKIMIFSYYEILFVVLIIILLCRKHIKSIFRGYSLFVIGANLVQGLMVLIFAKYSFVQYGDLGYFLMANMYSLVITFTLDIVWIAYYLAEKIG